MSINFYKVSKRVWVVTSESHPEPECFATPEAAFAFMEKNGVLSDEIDVALVDMLSGTTRAHFGGNGTFIYSDARRLEIGSA